jgi:hypothetical protein
MSPAGQRSAGVMVGSPDLADVTAALPRGRWLVGRLPGSAALLVDAGRSGQAGGAPARQQDRKEVRA